MLMLFAMIRSLVLAMALCLAPFTLMSQTVIYVRSNGVDGNDGASESTAKKSIQAAVSGAQAGDIIDIGPGTFAGATIDRAVVLQGANANYDIAKWDTSTVISSTLKLSASASNAAVTLVGLQFGPIVPLAGTAENANITIYNCKFLGSQPINTKGTKWGELFLTASIFDALVPGAKPGSQGAPTALIGGDVGISVIRENAFRNYAKSAIDVSGAGQVVRISYNEFSGCNASKDNDQAAVRIEASGIEQEVTIENSLFSSCFTSISMSGSIAGKSVVVQRNNFRQTPSGSIAIRNAAPSQLNASCNAFNVPTKDKEKPLDQAVIAASIKKLVTGSVQVSPTNLDGTDADGAAIGYEPEKSSVCASNLPE
ncbi:MAG: hypothetical protein ACKOE4_04175 [Candidatus Kapaibacterium sp.]